jgi:hypothetical protein
MSSVPRWARTKGGVSAASNDTGPRAESSVWDEGRACGGRGSGLLGWNSRVVVFALTLFMAPVPGLWYEWYCGWRG